MTSKTKKAIFFKMYIEVTSSHFLQLAHPTTTRTRNPEFGFCSDCMMCWIWMDDEDAYSNPYSKQDLPERDQPPRTTKDHTHYSGPRPGTPLNSNGKKFTAGYPLTHSTKRRIRKPRGALKILRTHCFATLKQLTPHLFRTEAEPSRPQARYHPPWGKPFSSKVMNRYLAYRVYEAKIDLALWITDFGTF